MTGYVGNFDVRLGGAVAETLQVGAIILAFGADLYDPQGEHGYGEFAQRSHQPGARAGILRRE